MIKLTMRKHIRNWLRRRSTKGLIGLSIAAITILIGLGGGAYALLGNLGSASSGNVNLQQGLAGWWKLDGNLKDSTPNADNGTASGTTSYVADRKAKSSGAINFDGSTGYVSAPNSTKLSPTNAVTVTAWINPNVTPTTNTGIVSKDASGSITIPPYVLQTSSTGKIQFGITNASNVFASATSGSSPSAGNWYYLVGTYDGSTIRLYVNGTQIGTSTQTDLATTTGTLKIGQQKAGTSRFFNGAIDDVRVYNRAINTSEVTALYNQYDPATNIGSGENGLIGWWKLNGATKDSTPFGNNLTNTNATLTPDRTGAANSAYYFNGSACMRTTPSSGSPLYTDNSLSISAWIYPTGNSTSQMIVRSGVGSDEKYSLSYNGTSGRLVYSWYDGSTYPAVLSSASAVPLNQWSHVVVTVSAARNLTFYVNGVAKGTGTTTVAPNNVTSYLSIGSAPCGTAQQLTGSLADVRIYRRALTVSDISAIYSSYNSQINLNTPVGGGSNAVNLNNGLVGYWPFNGNAKDSTVYQDHGVVNAATLSTDRNSNVNKAYSFNGTSAYISTALPTPTKQLTVSGWLYTNASTIGLTAVSKYSTGSPQNGDWLLGTGATAGTWRFLVRKGGLPYSVQDSTNYTTNGWHFIVGTSDGTNVNLYVDGNFVASTTLGGNGNLPLNSEALRFGNRSTNDNYWNGYVDDVRIYNRALNSSEVSTLYTMY